jgi:hypothetical protein
MSRETQLLSRHEIEQALRRLGEIAVSEGHTVEVLIIGGAAMMLGYDARPATRDVDGVFFEPPPASVIRCWIEEVASDFGLPSDWFNDAAKGFLVGYSRSRKVFSAPGIDVWQPLPEQLLSMKLAAWRDNRDIGDARILLVDLTKTANRSEIWSRIEPFLIPGSELKTQLAFNDLWDDIHGDSD